MPEACLSIAAVQAKGRWPSVARSEGSQRTSKTLVARSRDLATTMLEFRTVLISRPRFNPSNSPPGYPRMKVVLQFGVAGLLLLGLLWALPHGCAQTPTTTTNNNNQNNNHPTDTNNNNKQQPTNNNPNQQQPTDRHASANNFGPSPRSGGWIFEHFTPIRSSVFATFRQKSR